MHTYVVLLQSAWKYAKPSNDTSLQDLVEYERVVRYNYKTEEKFALVEFISMIKSLASLMLKFDCILSPIIRSSIHDEVQEFIQTGKCRDITCEALIHITSHAQYLLLLFSSRNA